MEKRPPKTKVKVVVRLRPTLSPQDKSFASVEGNNVHIINHRNIGERLTYEFHTVFDEKATQAEVFSTSVQPLLKNLLNGQNVSVFAYGPTGAGKTHTMLGMPSDPGIIPRVVMSLFKSIKDEESACESGKAPQFKVTFSYLEIYNEKVHDLLTPSQTDLPIREDASHNIFVADLSEKGITSYETFMNHFEPASSNRTVGATKLNANSSRSHTLLMVKVHRREHSGKLLRGKLYLIDLAGSEDNRRTGNSGIRLKESGAINKSLFVLGEVVDAINSNLIRVPYRNSKLTRLLQDSIGGSCQSVMITNIAPEERFYYDTYCTLNFATKSKKIVNTVTVDEVKPVAKPTAAVQPIKRRRSSLVPQPRPKSSRRSISESDTKSKSTSALPSALITNADPLPSDSQGFEDYLVPLVRQQKEFQSAIEEKVQAIEKLVEQLNQQKLQLEANQASCSSKSSANSSVPSSPPLPPRRRSSRRSSRGLGSSLVSVRSDDSPDVICATPQKPRLTDSTNTLLNQRYFGRQPAQNKNKKLKEQYNVLDDDASLSPFFPKPKKSKAGKRKSSEDFESPTRKKVKSASEKFNNHDQSQRNEDFLNRLNTGSVKELQQLQTVGAKRAMMIFEWRRMNGAFNSVKDVLCVPGFTEKSLQKLLIGNFVTETE